MDVKAVARAIVEQNKRPDYLMTAIERALDAACGQSQSPDEYKRAMDRLHLASIRLINHTKIELPKEFIDAVMNVDGLLNGQSKQ